MINKFYHNQNGSALLMTMMILSSILIVVLAAGSLAISGLRMSRVQENSAKAYYAAESGVEYLIWAIGKGGFDIGTCSVNQYVNITSKSCQDGLESYPLSNGASYYLQYASSSPISFTVTGSFGNISRSVEISY